MTQGTFDFDKKQQPYKANKQGKKKVTRVVPNNNTLLDQLFSYEVQHSYFDDETIEGILSDLTVAQSDESRKGATEKREISIISKNETYVRLLKKAFNPDVISQVLDTYMYGFNVFEVNWEEKEGLWVPVLKQRDYREFQYDEHEVLHFMPNGQLLPIEEYKVITATYRKRFNKLYGSSMLSKLYFPVKLKKASLGFWAKFLEKFGSPWAVGKTDQDLDNLADEINAMLAGDTAIIDPEEDIELVHPDGSRGDFDKLIAYCDGQINRAMLGGNLTGEVVSGSLAAAKVHNEIREDLAMADRKILEHVMAETIRYFVEVNGISEEIEAKLLDEDEPHIELAGRDKSIFDMGYRPTKSYIESTYNIEVVEVESKTVPNKTPFKERLIANKSEDKEEQKAFNNAVVFEQLVASFVQNSKLNTSNFMELLEKAESYEDLLDSLESLENVDEETVKDAILISELYGMSQDV